MSARIVKRAKQRGVAVVTALLLTTLAITIVASLFWQQQVQVRSIENQRLQLQKQWILRGALDWIRLILRADFAISPGVDHLGEPWAVPLAETRLDDYVENGRANGDVPDAVLWGRVVDAQSRFNLKNLAANGQPNVKAIKAFQRLLTGLQLNPALAQAAADLMMSAQKQAPAAPDQGAAPGNAAGAVGEVQGTAKPMSILHLDDLLAVPGFTPDALAKLKDFVIVLPNAGTSVNVNTAPPEVLSAIIDTLSLSEATALVASRDNAYFKDAADFEQRLQQQGKSNAERLNPVDVKTGFFLINGNVRMNRAAMEMYALIRRDGTNTEVIWIREN